MINEDHWYYFFRLGFANEQNQNAKVHFRSDVPLKNRMQHRRPKFSEDEIVGVTLLHQYMQVASS